MTSGALTSLIAIAVVGFTAIWFAIPFRAEIKRSFIDKKIDSDAPSDVPRTMPPLIKRRWLQQVSYGNAFVIGVFVIRFLEQDMSLTDVALIAGFYTLLHALWDIKKALTK